jgi:tetratricopeptide (TPR) repeat protein
MVQAARVIAEDEPLPLGTIERYCRGDLETIVAKALEKEPDRRYQSVSQLADDLRRFLDDQPIEARRASRLYQLRKFARRNRVLVGGLAGVFAALLLGVVGTAWQWARAADQRDRALDAERRARANLTEAYESAYAMHELAEVYLSNIAGALPARLVQAERALSQILDLGFDDLPSRCLSVSYAYQRVGDVQLPLGRSNDALATYQMALGLREQAHTAALEDRDMARALAVGHWKVADTLFHMGRYENCLSHNEAALKLLEAIAALPDAPQTEQGYLSYAHRRIADALAALGRHDEALSHYPISLEHLDRWNRPESAVADRQRRRGRINALRGWGELLLAQNQPEAALEKSQAALNVVEQLGRDEGPMNVWERTNESRIRSSMSAAHAMSGSHELAIESALRAVEVAQSLAEADRENVESRHALAHALLARAMALSLAGRNDDAVTPARQAADILIAAIQIDPDFAAAHRDLIQARDIAQIEQE